MFIVWLKTQPNKTGYTVDNKDYKKILRHIPEEVIKVKVERSRSAVPTHFYCENCGKVHRWFEECQKHFDQPYKHAKNNRR